VPNFRTRFPKKEFVFLSRGGERGENTVFIGQKEKKEKKIRFLLKCGSLEKQETFLGGKREKAI